MDWSHFLSVLLGGVLAIAASAISSWMQTRTQQRVEMSKLAFEAGIKAWERKLDVMRAKGGGIVGDLVYDVLFYHQVLDLIRRGRFDLSELEKMWDQYDKEMKSVKEKIKAQFSKELGE